jgi:hypothetical protein
MSHSIDKSQFLDELRRARAEWETLLAKVDATQMEQPGVCGEWSVKDLIGHLTWHDGEMAGLLKKRALASSELWALPTDQRNAVIFEQNKVRSLSDVRREAAQVYKTFLGLAEALDERDLHNPGRFADMPPDWDPAALIAENTYEHYSEHIPQVEAWLAIKKEDL